VECISGRLRHQSGHKKTIGKPRPQLEDQHGTARRERRRDQWIAGVCRIASMRCCVFNTNQSTPLRIKADSSCSVPPCIPIAIPRIISAFSQFILHDRHIAAPPCIPTAFPHSQSCSARFRTSSCMLTAFPRCMPSSSVANCLTSEWNLLLSRADR
jgi:hypothetical protein